MPTPLILLRVQVLYGLPHRPWQADYPANAQIGRFIKHISILKCEACAKDGSYIAGEVGVAPGRKKPPKPHASTSVDRSILPRPPRALLRLFWAGGAT